MLLFDPGDFFSKAGTVKKGPQVFLTMGEIEKCMGIFPDGKDPVITVVAGKR
jgi:hypothetical protein